MHLPEWKVSLVPSFVILKEVLLKKHFNWKSFVTRTRRRKVYGKAYFVPSSSVKAASKRSVSKGIPSDPPVKREGRRQVPIRKPPVTVLCIFAENPRKSHGKMWKAWRKVWKWPVGRFVEVIQWFQFLKASVGSALEWEKCEESLGICCVARRKAETKQTSKKEVEKWRSVTRRTCRRRSGIFWWSCRVRF